MGSPRQDRQQPIIIQNLDLLLPGQLKFRRKPLSTANLYLSAASFRRQAGVLPVHPCKCLQSDTQCGCLSVHTSILSTSGNHILDSSFRGQAVGIIEPVFLSGAEGSCLDQGKLTSICEPPSLISRSTCEDQVSLLRSAYPDVPNTACNDTDTGNSNISDNHKTHRNNYCDISNNHSDKITAPRNTNKKDNALKELAQNNTPVTKQRSRQKEPCLVNTDSRNEDKTACAVFVNLELNNSQLGFELLPSKEISATENSFHDLSATGHTTNISCGIQNSKSHVTDKTMIVEETDKTLDRCDLLSVNVPVEEADSRSTSDVCSEHSTRKLERTRTQIKRVSFKLAEDEDVGKCSNSEVSAHAVTQAVTGPSKWDRDQVSSPLCTGIDGQSEDGNVNLIPQLLNTGNASGYICDSSIHSPAAKNGYNPLHNIPKGRFKPFSLREQQSSRGGDRSLAVSQGYPRQNNPQKFLKQEYVMKRRTGSNYHSHWNEEVTSVTSFSDQQHGGELLQVNKNYQPHNKSDTIARDNYTGTIDSVYVSNKTVSTKPDSTGHTDGDLILINPKPERDKYKDYISMSTNSGSDVNTDYLKRMYSAYGNRVDVLDIARVLDKDVRVDHTSPPDEELTDLSRHAGHINRTKNSTCLNNPNTKCFKEPEHEELFNVRLRQDERLFTSSGLRSASAKEKLFTIKDNMKYVDRYLFQVGRRENQRTRMNKKLEDLLVSNLRYHKPTKCLHSSRTSLL